MDRCGCVVSFRRPRGAPVYLHLIAELKRRRVFRALVGYGIAAFAVLQIVEPVMHGLRWPEVTLSYVVVALAIGLPIVVSLAWLFDVNAGTVLEGSVRREGNQLRVVAQLIGAADGYHLWSKTYDRELKGVFSLEDELARAIVQALKPRLVPAAALVQQTTSNAEAHDLYLKGRFFWNQRSREGFAKATALFEQAIALDPTYALAHSGLADCYSLSVDYARARAAVVLPKAKAHARKALELDDSLAEAHTSLGMVSELDFDWSSAEHEYKRAIELRPGYATAHHWYFLLLAQIGHLTEAREEAERARQLDPTSGIINAAL